MGARNTSDGFGWVSRLLHWVMAVAVLGMLGFGTFLARMEPSLGNLWLYELHKSVGFCVLATAFLRVLWHRISPPPMPLTEGIPPWQQCAARWVHLALYLLLFAIPLTGWIASAATGIGIRLFGLVPIPQIVPPSELLDRVFFALHGLLTKTLAALLLLHVAGAVHRHVVHHDRTLRRMWKG